MFGMELIRQTPQANWPMPGAIVALLKPITWFPPMWAYACGAISTGPWDGWAAGVQSSSEFSWPGRFLCGTSQAVNDWFDRHVDAIKTKPDRVIPSGRMPGQWGLYISIIMSALSLVVAGLMGTFIFAAALLGLAFAWAYSAPAIPLQAKRLAGQWRCRLQLRNFTLADSRHRHDRPCAGNTHLDRCFALWPWCPWHPDAERFQGDCRRQRNGHPDPSRSAWGTIGSHHRLRRHERGSGGCCRYTLDARSAGLCLGNSFCSAAADGLHGSLCP